MKLLDVQIFGRQIAYKISRSLAPPQVYAFISAVGVDAFVHLSIDFFQRPEFDNAAIPAPVRDFLRGVLEGRDEVGEAMSRLMHEVMPPQAFEI